jgi:hypothetical protein
MTPHPQAGPAERPRTKRCKCRGERKRVEAFLRARYERDGLMRSCAACVGAGDGIRARLGYSMPLETAGVATGAHLGPGRRARTTRR